MARQQQQGSDDGQTTHPQKSLIHSSLPSVSGDENLRNMTDEKHRLPQTTSQTARRRRGSVAQTDGLVAETQSANALVAEGWQVLGQRVRTAAGELDLIIERDGLLVFVEVKQRPTLAEAAYSLSRRQIERLMLAAEIWLAEHPGHGGQGVRFDLLLRDPKGQMRRVVDAFRLGMG
jgi:putative endonuclease